MLFAVALAGTALLVAVGSRSRVNPQPVEPTADAEALKSATAEILALRNDVIELRKTVAELNRMLASTGTVAGGQAPPMAVMTARDPSAGSDAQIAQLKESIDQFRQGLVQRGMLPPGSNEVALNKSVILDPKAGIEEKMTALRVLRSADARSDDIVKQMIEVYQSTENPDVRADIFRQLDGVTTAELKAPLLEAVSKSPHANVREEAAETLFHYLSDPAVKPWLEHLAVNDPDPRVREQAAESLARAR